VSLVGYTNAGKSTLFNALTHAGVYAADQFLPLSIRRAGGCFSRRESLWSCPIRWALFGSFLTA
jgi:hypothetical protein